MYARGSQPGHSHHKDTWARDALQHMTSSLRLLMVRSSKQVGGCATSARRLLDDSLNGCDGWCSLH